MQGVLGWQVLGWIVGFGVLVAGSSNIRNDGRSLVMNSRPLEDSVEAIFSPPKPISVLPLYMIMIGLFFVAGLTLSICLALVLLKSYNSPDLPSPFYSNDNVTLGQCLDYLGLRTPNISFQNETHLACELTVTKPIPICDQVFTDESTNLYSIYWPNVYVSQWLNDPTLLVDATGFALQYANGEQKAQLNSTFQEWYCRIVGNNQSYFKHVLVKDCPN
ncbi:hypothetical protein NEHOM01_1464 [Nematocida homosporus]|uniref:uncharacterized protein n=1 Tax=Nematocida homosporus TaxID=1912981 RepID=UPI00221EB7A0|nr:uncharacterized protein NEHOM01_1464 [Nematocida homosporus]KAI5186431.1 hypothetical protein NEHOM01_1464 [Nematocida homosporus]